ncbi:acyltransferase [Neobacillus drentensis]|uniref:acyltransferase n=1 Tax=Neobacillus drentensis TaxID=220684 RepID=UPI002FFE5A2C
MTYYIHPKAIVETNAIGENTRIWAFSHILPGASIGMESNICDHTFIENDVLVGNRVTIKSGVYIWDGARISDDVFIGPNVTFTNDLIPRSKKYPDKFLQTIIEQGASIGANATIIAGNKIGMYAMVGAGSVVTKEIPNNTLWYGNPAKFIANICDCGNKLDNDLLCGKCNESYYLKNNQLHKENKKR